MKPIPKPEILKIKPYTPGSSSGQILGIRKLSSNENLYGPSPRVISAIKESLGSLWLYPSVTHDSLREAIAEVHELPFDQIICGAGSDEILALIAYAYAGVGDEVITTEHGFEMYGIVTRVAQATEIKVPEIDRKVCAEPILDALSDRTRIIFIANPANPTGTMMEMNTLETLIKRVPQNVLIVLDAAYIEFSSKNFDGGVALALSRPNVVMTRTFSKLYGLGGLRVGWALGPRPVIDMLNRVRLPFNLPSLALIGARAAVLDRAYTETCLGKIKDSRDFLTKGLRKIGIAVDDSHANFVLPRFANQIQATQIRDFLQRSGYLVRMVDHYGLAQGLRITIGTGEDCSGILAALSTPQAQQILGH